jgi:hypothetical protein
MFGPRKNQTPPAGNLAAMRGQLDLPAVPAAWPVAVSSLARAVEAFRHGTFQYGDTGIEISAPANAPPPTFWPHEADPTDAEQTGKSAK